MKERIWVVRVGLRDTRGDYPASYHKTFVGAQAKARKIVAGYDGDYREDSTGERWYCRETGHEVYLATEELND